MSHALPPSGLGPRRKTTESPLANRIFVLAGLVSGFFSLHSTGEMDPADAFGDFSMALFFFFMCVVAYWVSNQKETQSS